MASEKLPMSAHIDALLNDESTAELQPIVAFIVVVVLIVMFLLPSRRKAPGGSVKPTGPGAATQVFGEALSALDERPLDVPNPASAAPSGGSRLQKLVKDRVIDPKKGSRFASIVQAVALDNSENHAERVAERRAELDSLKHERSQLQEQLKGIREAVTERRAHQREELAKGGFCELTEDQVWEFHAHELPVPNASATKPLDPAIFDGVLSYVQTNKDVELVCNGGSVWCNSSVLRATSGVLGLVGQKCSLPEEASAAELLCRVLHGDVREREFTVADCAEVLPLLGKYACPVVEAEIRGALLTAVQGSEPEAFQVYLAVYHENSLLAVQARSRAVELFPFDFDEKAAEKLSWAALEPLLKRLGLLRRSKDVLFLKQWETVHKEEGIDVQAFISGDAPSLPLLQKPQRPAYPRERLSARDLFTVGLAAVRWKELRARRLSRGSQDVSKTEGESPSLKEATQSEQQVEAQARESIPEVPDDGEESSPSRSVSPGRVSRVSFGEVSVHVSPENSPRASSAGTAPLPGDLDAEESPGSRTASPSTETETDLPSDTTDLPAANEEDMDQKLLRLDNDEMDQKLEQTSVGSAPATPKRDSLEAELDARSDSPKRTKMEEPCAADDSASDLEATESEDSQTNSDEEPCAADDIAKEIMSDLI
jgi:hypothetical protein